mgnify:CR=1 FL=1
MQILGVVQEREGAFLHFVSSNNYFWPFFNCCDDECTNAVFLNPNYYNKRLQKINGLCRLGRKTGKLHVQKNALLHKKV